MENLIRSIQIVNDAKTIHTRNKSIFYLRKWKEDGKKRAEDLNALTNACQKALQKNDWSNVKFYLRRCW